MTDTRIYESQEYRARIERAKTSLIEWEHYDTHQLIAEAAERIAYWQMRALHAETHLAEPIVSNRHD